VKYGRLRKNYALSRQNEAQPWGASNAQRITENLMTDDFCAGDQHNPGA